jgi:rhamnosyltransferase
MLSVSIIIPTLNGGETLGKLFGTLQEQSVRPAQIFVVDSSSKDNTIKICNAFRVDLIQIEPKTFDHGGTRNLAASRAIGDIIVFLTQDALFRDAGGLENLIRPLDDPKIAASYGRQLPREGVNPIERFVRSFNYPPIGMIKGIDDLPRLGVKTFFFSNSCSAIKKRAFQEVGGFPEKTIMNEDMFLAAKLLQRGYKVAYQPEAVVYHSHNCSLAMEFKRYFDIGVFFNRNRWIGDLARSEREGFKYLKAMLRFLVGNKQWNWIPYALLDTTVRFLGYRVGLSESSLPLSIKKKISSNKGFWEQDVSPA